MTDQDLESTASGQILSDFTSAEHLDLYLYFKKLSFSLDLFFFLSDGPCWVCSLSEGDQSHLGPSYGFQHIGEALIWSVRGAGAASPSRDGAVFVLRVCKLEVIRLLSNDVGRAN